MAKENLTIRRTLTSALSATLTTAKNHSDRCNRPRFWLSRAMLYQAYDPIDKAPEEKERGHYHQHRSR